MLKTKFLRPDVLALLGFTPICTVADEEIWNHLLTPMTRALLGPIVSDGKVEVRETVAGAFPGDEVTNFNDHRLYGGQTGFVRNRYLVSIYKTQFGAFIVKRDGVKFKAFGYFGDLDKGRLELIFKGSLRDRRFDGTARTNDCSLLDFEGFEDPVYNNPLTIKGERVKAVELSIYCFMPGSRIAAIGKDLSEYEQFVANPFKFLDRPELFLQYFDRAFNSERAPGQVSNAIPDVSKFVAPAFEEIARNKGYDFIENAPSHYHVAMWGQSIGYLYADPAQEQAIKDLTAGIARLKASGVKLTRPQESWVCVLQSLDPKFIPAHLNLGGPKWPQDNIGAQNLWVFKPLTDSARKMLAAK